MQDPSLYEYPDYPQMKPDFTVDQAYDGYTAEDHAVWQALYTRQMPLIEGAACREYVEGAKKLRLAEDRIPRFEELSAVLYKATGWELVAVPGLIPDDIFFNHLANKVFPVTHWIRPRAKLDYLQEPDLFHDLFGHVPLLMHPVFSDYLTMFGRGGNRALRLGSTRALEQISRLYWYTVEFGLIQNPDGLRIYGAGILSSKGEVEYSLQSEKPNRLGFQLERIMRTKYRIDDYQETYWVIESFDQLYEATLQDFKPIYATLAEAELIGAGDVLPTDKVLHRGQR
jgi:phenylalanine-4-hydroxylase